MDFGINLATAADSWKVVKRAEELGYARAWFYDTQMLNADVFVAMGRVDFGISTGFTARRTMGLGPVKLDDMQQYIGIVQRLLAGETVEWTFEGKRRKIRFLSPELDVVNVK